MHRTLLKLIFTLTLASFAHSSFATLTDLLPNEQKTIDIFQKFSPKVVYVHRLDGSKTVGAGSGIIWDTRGHVVTNFHVVKDAKNLAVSMGKMKIPARVIGAEPRKDIAVLALNTAQATRALANFVPFELAPTKDLMVGQNAIAIGNPFGLDHSLTVGVISALKRKVPGIGGVTIHDMIQTDASINPGNSGGPLLDSKGRLIGLNTIIYSNTGTSNGIGFAVPADDIARIVPQIISKGHAELAGIGVQRASPEQTERKGVKQGLLIASVLNNSPAAEAGLHEGDVIIGINGNTVKNYDTFYNLLSGVKISDTILVTIIRDAKTLHYKMKTIDIETRAKSHP